MRKMRWLAAVLAAGVVGSYCVGMQWAVRTGGGRKGVVMATPTMTPTTTPTTTSTSTSTTTTTSTTTPTTTSTTTTTPTTTATTTKVGEPGTQLFEVTGPEWAGGKFGDFSREELEEMAARCELRWQMPRAPSERYVAAARALYVEITGDERESRPRVIDDMLRAESDEGAIDVHKRLAERRAGAEVAASGSVYERYLQLQLDEAERARRDGDELGPKFTMTGCDPDHALFRSSR